MLRADALARRSSREQLRAARAAGTAEARVVARPDSSRGRVRLEPRVFHGSHQGTHFARLRPAGDACLFRLQLDMCLPYARYGSERGGDALDALASSHAGDTEQDVVAVRRFGGRRCRWTVLLRGVSVVCTTCGEQGQREAQAIQHDRTLDAEARCRVNHRGRKRPTTLDPVVCYRRYVVSVNAPRRDGDTMTTSAQPTTLTIGAAARHSPASADARSPRR